MSIIMQFMCLNIDKMPLTVILLFNIQCSSFSVSFFSVIALQGATIRRDEHTGAILVARIMRGGAADRSGQFYLFCLPKHLYVSLQCERGLYHSMITFRVIQTRDVLMDYAST